MVIFNPQPRTARCQTWCWRDINHSPWPPGRATRLDGQRESDESSCPAPQEQRETLILVGASKTAVLPDSLCRVTIRAHCSQLSG